MGRRGSLLRSLGQAKVGNGEGTARGAWPSYGREVKSGGDEQRTLELAVTRGIRLFN